MCEQNKKQLDLILIKFDIHFYYKNFKIYVKKFAKNMINNFLYYDD